jgi:hypothetical protein
VSDAQLVHGPFSGAVPPVAVVRFSADHSEPITMLFIDATVEVMLVTANARGARAVLVGELDDNPGTTVTNALEGLAESVRRELLDGDPNFELYEFVPKGLPKLQPTFYRIEWRGEPGHFSMPEWQVVDPGSDPWLRDLRSEVMEKGYTAQTLIAERKLEVIDSRRRDDLPIAS